MLSAHNDEVTILLDKHVEKDARYGGDLEEVHRMKTEYMKRNAQLNEKFHALEHEHGVTVHEMLDYKVKLTAAENRCRHLEASVEKIRVVAKTVVEDMTGETGFDIRYVRVRARGLGCSCVQAVERATPSRRMADPVTM